MFLAANSDRAQSFMTRFSKCVQNEKSLSENRRVAHVTAISTEAIFESCRRGVNQEEADRLRYLEGQQVLFQPITSLDCLKSALLEEENVDLRVPGAGDSSDILYIKELTRITIDIFPTNGR